jgi:uncharacterized protein with FMN-binding domain
MKKTMLFACAAAVVLCSIVMLGGCVNTSSIVIRNPDLTALADGIYEGEEKVGPVEAKVRIEMASARIESFTILEHGTLLGKKAEILAQLVVEKQSLELDTVSGATVSSKAILKAGQNALETAPVE